ncbi:NAD-dependent protein deacetylase Sirt6 isoform X2 [Belonocnema kinseyi]|uniref:NAD-dependent protein deacetylase Sirt6 isoform X2 n=1 Tax=Belonocnema kinseyi TaxID=2817044 RepID=UPI00143D2F80|nr:NAD-dependent protein deacetylase Sirt6 isoform X2 [Belonocnema kinseyi]
MSCTYADGLSPYEDKGVLGLEEKYDTQETLRLKCDLLADWIKAARHVVVHTGAGISTAAGIPDFRGPNGVWTLEKKGEKPSMSVAFDDAIPTKSHMAIKKLIDANKVKYIVSQNIDGLHLKSGVGRHNIAELHGNMFVEQCDKCGRQFIRNCSTKSVGKKCLETVCRSGQIGGRPCRGKMHDTILDWEHNLPNDDLALSDLHSSVADLSICLGSTLQIIPSGNLPLYTKKYGGRLVICNLQPTKHDKKADLIINGKIDDIMTSVMKTLGLEIPEYKTELDPTRNTDVDAQEMDWTIPTSQIKEMKILYKKVCTPVKRKRKTFMYERDDPKPVKKERKAFLPKPVFKFTPKSINELKELNQEQETKEESAVMQDSNANQSHDLKEEAIKEEPTSSNCDIINSLENTDASNAFRADESSDINDFLESNII